MYDTTHEAFLAGELDPMVDLGDGIWVMDDEDHYWTDPREWEEEEV